MIVDVTKQIKKHTEAIQDLHKVICFSDKKKVQYYARDLIKDHRKQLKLSLQKLQVLS